MKRARVLGVLAAATISLVIIAYAGCQVFAGEVPLQWDHVTCSQGTRTYTVHSGTATGTYTNVQNVGDVNAYTKTGLTDCTTFYLAAKAVCTVGTTIYTSATFSNEVSGWPRIFVTSTNPAQLVAPATGVSTVPLGLVGGNIRNGFTATTTYPGLRVLSTSSTDCRNVTINLELTAATLQPGSAVLTITNPEGTFGTLGLSVQQATIIVPIVPNLGRTDISAVLPPVPPTSSILDDGDPGTSKVGYWRSTDLGIPTSTAHGGDYSRANYAQSQTGIWDTYTWNLTGLAPGGYDVFAHIPPDTQVTSRWVQAALYTIAGNTVTIDQRARTADNWHFLGRFILGTTATVTVRKATLPNDSSKNLIADAVKIVGAAS